MDLERSLVGMGIEDAHWAPDSAQGWPSGGGPVAPSTAWGHLSPQLGAPLRNVWQEPANLSQNETLGTNGGAPRTAWSSGGQENDFSSVKHIWQEPSAEQPSPFYPNMPTQQKRMINGVVGDAGADWGRPEAVPNLWNDPLKKEETFWNQPAGASGNWQQGGGGGVGVPPRWPQGGPQGGMPPAGIRAQPPPNPMARTPQVNGPPGWGAPNGMMPGPNPGLPNQPMWDQRMRNPMPGAPPQQGRYPDVSVPPPVEMAFQNMNMRGPPQQPGQMWKPEPPMMRPQVNYPQPGFPDNEFGGTFMNKSPPQFAPGGVNGGSPQEDLMWHDPNGDLKKWQRDTGVSIWGDPDRASSAQQSVKLWKVGEGEDEDLEVALMRCPVPQKKVESEDGSSRSSMQLPPKRPIVVTGWGELPDNDPNNPKPEAGNQLESASDKWFDNVNDWFLGSNGQSTAISQDWSNGGNELSQHTAATAEKLRIAVEKGYLDMAILQQHHLPPQVLSQMNTMLTKIPALEEAEQEIETLIESVRPDGETERSSPQWWMTEEQKVEHNSLIIKVTTLRIEVGVLSKKIQKALAEAGMIPSPELQPPPQSTADNYNYAFLEA